MFLTEFKFLVCPFFFSPIIHPFLNFLLALRSFGVRRVCCCFPPLRLLFFSLIFWRRFSLPIWGVSSLCAWFPNVKLFSCEGGGCGVEMECIQASCMHLFPSPGKRSCRDNNHSRNSNAARELVVARSLEGETAGDFPPSCSYGNIHTHTYPCFFFFFFFFSETLRNRNFFLLQSSQRQHSLG